MNRKRFAKYLYGNTDELSDFWPYDAPQQDKFHYAFYEVRLDCHVDLDTGEAWIESVNGTRLMEPVKA